MDKMGKCRSIVGGEKAEWEVSFIQGHGIRRVWRQIQPSLAPILYPNDTRKAACAALCTFMPSLSSFPEPLTFSWEHLLFMAPRPGPLWSLHPRPALPPLQLQEVGGGEERQRWETPFAFVPSTSSTLLLSSSHFRDPQPLPEVPPRVRTPNLPPWVLP